MLLALLAIAIRITPSHLFLTQTNQNLERTIGFNISHDNDYVVMAFQKHIGQADSAEAPQTDAVDVTSIGVDVMKIALPRYERTLASFVNNISDTVSLYLYSSD